MTSGTPEYRPMLIAVADFMREKCIASNNKGQNGETIAMVED